MSDNELNREIVRIFHKFSSPSDVIENITRLFRSEIGEATLLTRIAAERLLVFKDVAVLEFLESREFPFRGSIPLHLELAGS